MLDHADETINPIYCRCLRYLVPITSAQLPEGHSSKHVPFLISAGYNSQQLHLINKLLIIYPGSRSGREATATKLQKTRDKRELITLRI